MFDLSALSVKNRLVLGTGVALLMMVILTAVGIQKVNFIDSTLSVITDVNSVKQRYAINYRGSVHDRAIAIRDVAIARSASEISSFENEINELRDFYNESERNMNAMLRGGDTEFSRQERDILNRIDAIKARTIPMVEQILQLKKQGQDVQGMILDQARPAFTEWLGVINEFIDYQERANQTATPQAREEAGGFSTLMILFTLGAIAVSTVIGFMISNSLTGSLGGEPNDVAHTISRIAKGDLTETIHSKHRGSILESVASMSSQLTQTVRNIMGAAEELSQQTGTVSHSSEEIFQAAQNQANLTNQTASKLEQLTGNSNQVAEIATLTQENSSKTVQFADEGRTAMESAAAEMERIRETVNNTVKEIQELAEQTTKIGGIANVISGISEQTNLLALNAAIEAARAGESGRGFAVVADEVRQLAQRTGEATSQIESMISQVQSEAKQAVSAMEETQPLVENGRVLTREATDLLLQIDTQAKDSLSQVQNVVAVAKEQVNAINDVTRSMDKIAAASNDTIGALQDNNAATQSLSALSEQLKGEVQYFSVRG